MLAKVTELSAWKKTRMQPIQHACRWSEAIEQAAATNLRIFFAWQRIALRSLWRL